MGSPATSIISGLESRAPASTVCANGACRRRRSDHRHSTRPHEESPAESHDRSPGIGTSWLPTTRSMNGRSSRRPGGIRSADWTAEPSVQARGACGSFDTRHRPLCVRAKATTGFSPGVARRHQMLQPRRGSETGLTKLPIQSLLNSQRNIQSDNGNFTYPNRSSH